MRGYWSLHNNINNDYLFLNVILALPGFTLLDHVTTTIKILYKYSGCKIRKINIVVIVY